MSEETKTEQPAEAVETKEEDIKGIYLVQVIVALQTQQVVQVTRLFDESKLAEGATKDKPNEEAFLKFDTEEELVKYFHSDECNLKKSPLLTGIIRDVSVTPKEEEQDAKPVRCSIQIYLVENKKISKTLFEVVAEDVVIETEMPKFKLGLKVVPGADIEAIKQQLQPVYRLDSSEAILASIDKIEDEAEATESSEIPTNEAEDLEVVS
jgi:hypothetical protein